MSYGGSSHESGYFRWPGTHEYHQEPRIDGRQSTQPTSSSPAAFQVQPLTNLGEPSWAAARSGIDRPSHLSSQSSQTYESEGLCAEPHETMFPDASGLGMETHRQGVQYGRTCVECGSKLQVLPRVPRRRSSPGPRQAVKRGHSEVVTVPGHQGRPSNEQGDDRLFVPEHPLTTSSQPRFASSSFKRQVGRFLCIKHDGQPRRLRRNTASAPTDPNSRPETPGSTPREQRISELRKMPIARSERRRRARISSEYYSSSGTYTPLYPSPIGIFHVPCYPTTEGSKRRSKSEVPYGALSGQPWHAYEACPIPEDDEPRVTGRLHDSDWRAASGQPRRRRKRQSRTRVTEACPAGGTDPADLNEPHAPPTSNEAHRGPRRILRRNSTGTVQVMDMQSWRDASGDGDRGGSY